MSNNSISAEEGFELVGRYVEYFWKERCFSARLKYEYDMEDVVSEVYVKLLEKRYFEKWDKHKASKKYYVSLAVKRKLIDIWRGHRERISLNEEDDEGISLLDKLKSDIDTVDEVVKSRLKDMLYQLPESRQAGKVIMGSTPVLGKCKLSMKSVAVHMAMGYNGREISEWFDSPYREGSVSPPTIYNIRDKIEEYLKEKI